MGLRHDSTVLGSGESIEWLGSNSVGRMNEAKRIRQKDTPTEIPIVKPEANDKIDGCAIFVVALRCLSRMLSITN